MMMFSATTCKIILQLVSLRLIHLNTMKIPKNDHLYPQIQRIRIHKFARLIKLWHFKNQLHCPLSLRFDNCLTIPSRRNILFKVKSMFRISPCFYSLKLLIAYIYMYEDAARDGGNSSWGVKYRILFRLFSLRHSRMGLTVGLLGTLTSSPPWT